MASLQPFVSNIPLQVAKNLRFNDDVGIPVTQMLPVGMNGTTPNDTPRTGYISRIGAVLSDQIDLYNNVLTTLANHQDQITVLQAAVKVIQTSGSTVPNVNGYCYSGNAQSPITTVVQLMAQSSCDYNTVLGTTSALAQAIIAEGASKLNVLPAFSVNSAMSGLPGWISVPTTIADSLNNAWLSYLDSRTALNTMLNAVKSDCSQVLIDFAAVFYPGANKLQAGFNIFLSGYSFIPAGYTNNNSTIVISDPNGNKVTRSLDVVALSQPGANSFFVNISGTTLTPSAASYTVQLNSNVKNTGINVTCSKVVIRNTAPIKSSDCGCGCGEYQTGTFTTPTVDTQPIQVAQDLKFTPSFVDINALDEKTAQILFSYAYYLTPVANGFMLTFLNAQDSDLNISWIAYK